MKIYGSKICRGCNELKAVLDAKNIPYEFVEITENIPNLRAFLKMRDTNPMFDEIKEQGRVGLPVIELADGTLTLDVEKVLSDIENIIDQETETPAPAEEGGCCNGSC